MGDVLAEAVDRIYRESIESSEAWRRVQAGAGAVDVLELLGVHARAVRSAFLFLAQHIDDPDIVGEAMLESLRAYIATEPAG